MSKEVFVDGSELPPPEPLERAVMGLEQVKEGGFLRFVHRREPCLLYPMLAEQGWSEHTRTRADGLVEVLIWRTDDLQAEALVHSQVADL